MLLLIYLSLLVWGLVVASNSKDGFGSMVAVQLQLRLGRKPAPCSGARRGRSPSGETSCALLGARLDARAEREHPRTLPAGRPAAPPITCASHPNGAPPHVLRPHQSCARGLRGRPTIRGLRYTVEFVLKLLGDGYTADHITREYPELEREDVLQAARYGAWLASERSSQSREASRRSAHRAPHGCLLAREGARREHAPRSGAGPARDRAVAWSPRGGRGRADPDSHAADQLRSAIVPRAAWLPYVDELSGLGRAADRASS